MRKITFTPIVNGFVLLAMLAGVTQGQVSGRDIQVAQAKINQAQQYFAKTWSDLFRSMGYQFSPPRLVPFLNSSPTACGEVKAGNGFFCPRDNSIYLDAAFLASNMTRAAAALHTDGDYAPILIAAHEFGHVVAKQLNAVAPEKEFASEQVADCFAGVITRRAKTDGLLEQGDLAEGLFALSNAGDEVGRNVNMNSLHDTLIFMVRSGGLSHGFVEQRQAAFLQGYYGGPAFCAARVGQARPPAEGRVIASRPLMLLQSVPSGAKGNCSWSSGITGLRVHNSTGSGQCTLNLMGLGTSLPDNVRIELSATTSGNVSSGIYYGDGRSAGGLTTYVFQTNSVGGEEIKNLDRLSERIGGLRVNGMPWNLDKIKKPGENRLTLDIHHLGSDVYFALFVNGFMTDFGHSQLQGLRPDRQRAADEAGWAFAGTDALFKDFRVVALPD